MGELDLYTGAYYNSELDKLIMITKSTDHDNYYLVSEMSSDMYYQSEETVISALEEHFGITVKDSHTLLYNEKEFSLLSNLK